MRWFATILALIGQPAPSTAQQGCEVALVLLQDTSRSIESHEFEVMRAGLASALGHAQVAEQFGSGRIRVLVAVYGRREPQVVIDWFLADPDALRGAALRVSGMPRAQRINGTGTGAAMMWGVEQALAAGCRRAVVDIATDGENNIGPPPATVRQDFDPGAVTINGLFIGTDRKHREQLETEVRFGFGSFVVSAERWEDFADAMRRKLLLEVAEALGEAASG